MGQRLVGQDDECIASQQRQWLAELFVHRGLAAPQIGVIKAGHVIVHQRGTVQQFHCNGCGIAQGRGIVAAGRRNGQAQLRPYPRSPWEDGVTHG
jgi:hypothetical protein